MNRLYLKRPGPEDEKQVMDYRQAHLDCGETDMPGSAGLASAAGYAQWLVWLEQNAREETVRPGLVPASTFLVMRAKDGHMVGIIDIRHRLSEYLFQYGGHIGYGLRPDARGKGYGAEMLALGLEKCRERGIERVLLTCDSNNAAAARVMEKNGAVLENVVPDDEGITRRYWIDL